MDRAHHRIIDGTLYARAPTPYAYDLRVTQLGQHVEASALPRYAWHEVGNVSPSALSDAEREGFAQTGDKIGITAGLPAGSAIKQAAVELAANGS